MCSTVNNTEKNSQTEYKIQPILLRYVLKYDSIKSFTFNFSKFHISFSSLNISVSIYAVYKQKIPLPQHCLNARNKSSLGPEK